MLRFQNAHFCERAILELSALFPLRRSYFLESLRITILEELLLSEAFECQAHPLQLLPDSHSAFSSSCSVHVRKRHVVWCSLALHEDSGSLWSHRNVKDGWCPSSHRLLKAQSWGNCLTWLWSWSVPCWALIQGKPVLENCRMSSSVGVLSFMWLIQY